MIKKLLNKISNPNVKSTTVKTILNQKQKHNDVVNIHRLNPNNAGDYYCAPHNYFKKLEGKALDIFDYKSYDKRVNLNFINSLTDNSLIIGGGGLLNRNSFERQMKLFEKLALRNKKVVVWGVGHNDKRKKTFGKVRSYNVNPENFEFFATRDYDLPGEYVPCVSCLHSAFDKSYEVKEEIGVIFHSKSMKNDSITNKFNNYPSLSNKSDLEDLINFIGKYEGIITDSYHAMYWSFLLNKKVVVVPNSSKFFNFHLKPIFSNFDDCINDLKKAVRKGDGVLEECREINLQFSKKVFDYLDL